MSNFSFLENQTEYKLFSSACIEAERVLLSSPAMAAVGARKALELGVKWVYSADSTMQMPYQDNLQSLIHEQSFRFALDHQTWGKLPFIIKLGNLAVHTEKQVSRSDAMLSLSGLFQFIQWIDYCYGASYEERKFSEALVPSEKVVVDEKAIKEQQSVIAQKDEEIARLQAQIAAHSQQFMALKATEMPQRTFTPDDLTEFSTRKKYIDLELKLLGWTLGEDCREEVPVTDMAGVDGQPGFADYVLFGKDGLPLAVVEAKRTSKDPNVGRQQCKLYADALERRWGRRPLMFCTNGFETYFWDDLSYPQRAVSGLFSKSDLEKLIHRRDERKDLSCIAIDDRITDRYYQKEAIRAVCDNITTGHRKSLLVMATGTGKTRTASSLTDVLSRGGYITNILFLADRKALVKQAKDDFKNYLPDMSLCNLVSNKDDKNARIVFSTYPTILNAIDSAKTEDGQWLFTPAHFDLIIVDEAHRSIFKKYRAIFEYFDALVVGLTATPKIDVDHNTYDFFEIEQGVPTYAYDYETAVQIDHVLVPFYNIEIKMKFLDGGIVYEELSVEDKKRYEEDFIEDDGGLPDFIPSPKLNDFVFNQDTVDTVLQDLMTKGIKVEGGDRIGKTIIFANNKKHAQFILDRFDTLYPQYKGEFARRIICDDTYAQTLIDDFKRFNRLPQIAVSVDMMDTGIDVREVVNLVFFKKVRSKTKFWQMIGRGTRQCDGLSCVDSLNGAYTDKRRFYIFDYCQNFDFFREKQNGIEGKETQTLSEAIFGKQVRLVSCLQGPDFGGEDYQTFRRNLTQILCGQVAALNLELVSVRLQLGAVEKFKVLSSFDRISEQDKVRPPKADKAAPDKAEKPVRDKVSQSKKAPGKGGPDKVTSPAPEPVPPPDPANIPRPVEQGQIVYLKLSELHAFHTFRDHPYQVRDDDKMRELVGTIQEHGVMTPATVRPEKDGNGYEIIAGHRRQHGSQLAGLEEMPCIVRDMTDLEAVREMKISNKQRGDPLPSELAKLFDLEVEAIKHQGGALDGVAEGDVGKRSTEIVGENNGMNYKKVMRYIRLNSLVPDLLNMVDDKKMGFMPAVELSYIKPKNQRLIAVSIEGEQASPSLSQAQELRKLDKDGKLNGDVIDGILSQTKKEVDKVILSTAELGEFFDKATTPREMKDKIMALLAEDKAKQPMEHAKPEKKADLEK